MEWLSDIVEWAWARHHNILSWYIRPLFLLPFIYFSYKRNWKGILLTLVALITSMAWFPEPEVVDAKVVQFLEMEKQYLLGNWPLSKMLLSLLVPITLFALSYSFWKHSWKYGILVVNLIAILKILWSVLSAEKYSGWSLVPPALTGLLICDTVIISVYLWIKRRRV